MDRTCDIYFILFLFQTGGDGCICYLEYCRDNQNLRFIGMKRVKELSLVQSVYSGANFVDDLTSSTYATGFASTDFIIWNLITETKVLLSFYLLSREILRLHGLFHLVPKSNIEAGCANPMWWMEAPPFLLSW